jgi:DNA repair protein RadC
MKVETEAAPPYGPEPSRPSPPKYRPESKPPPRDARKPLKCAGDVFAAMSDLRGAQQEHFVCFDLNARHRVIARRVVHIGTLANVDVHPREVFRGAIAGGAAAVILAHNHPSGEADPSRADIEVTKRLREVGELCGIAVLDHVVVAEHGFISLAERGWS